MTEKMIVEIRRPAVGSQVTMVSRVSLPRFPECIAGVALGPRPETDPPRFPVFQRPERRNPVLDAVREALG